MDTSLSVKGQVQGEQYHNRRMKIGCAIAITALVAAIVLGVFAIQGNLKIASLWDKIHDWKTLNSQIPQLLNQVHQETTKAWTLFAFSMVGVVSTLAATAYAFYHRVKKGECQATIATNRAATIGQNAVL